jgi:hypothetical protein
LEIPSIEHPSLLEAALDEADRLGVTIGRMSMGGGTQLLTRRELGEMTEMAHSRGVTVFTFVSARASFEPLADGRAAEQVCGEDAFASAIAELESLALGGVDGVLIADVGLLDHVGTLKRNGKLGTLGLKTAAAIAPRNAAAARLYARLGATSINVAATAPLSEFRALRAALDEDVSIDIYVEASDDLGGGLRYRDLLEIVTTLAPVSLKIGIRGAAALYPYGGHLEPMAERNVREKLRRASIVIDKLGGVAGQSRDITVPPAAAALIPLDQGGSS